MKNILNTMDNIDIINVDDNNQYETKDEFMEIHTKTIDADFDDVGFLPEINTDEDVVDERFGY